MSFGPSVSRRPGTRHHAAEAPGIWCWWFLPHRVAGNTRQRRVDLGITNMSGKSQTPSAKSESVIRKSARRETGNLPDAIWHIAGVACNFRNAVSGIRILQTASEQLSTPLTIYATLSRKSWMLTEVQRRDTMSRREDVPPTMQGGNAAMLRAGRLCPAKKAKR